MLDCKLLCQRFCKKPCAQKNFRPQSFRLHLRLFFSRCCSPAVLLFISSYLLVYILSIPYFKRNCNSLPPIYFWQSVQIICGYFVKRLKPLICKGCSVSPEALFYPALPPYPIYQNGQTPFKYLDFTSACVRRLFRAAGGKKAPVDKKRFPCNYQNTPCIFRENMVE